MKHCSLAVLCAFAAAFAGRLCGMSRTIPSGPYFGQKPPGMTPEIFATGVVSLEDRYEYCITFSPDGKECCFGVTDSMWSICHLFYSKQTDGKWTEPEEAYFQDGFDGWTPFFTHDGNRFMFASGRPDMKTANIWQSRRNEAGWSMPVKLDSPINSSALEFKPTVSVKGMFYFCSNRSGGTGDYDIYRILESKRSGATIENIGEPVNSKAVDASPCISADGKFLIFESWREGGFGQGDLYISYSTNDGSWTAPRNLGPKINTEQIEDSGYISPDGKYLFFGRRKAWVTKEQTDIYWIDLKAIISEAPE